MARMLELYEGVRAHAPPETFFKIGLSETPYPTFPGSNAINSYVHIGVRAGGAREAAAPPNFGQLRFFGQREKFWAKPVF